MNNRILALLLVVGVLAFLGTKTFFQVNETELAIKFRFGEIVQTEYTPGLHMMIPLINDVRKFDRRVLTRNYPSEQFLTSEGKILNVDFYVKWRISDVGQYYRSTNGDEEAAARRLAEIVKDGLKGVIARRTIQHDVNDSAATCAPRGGAERPVPPRGKAQPPGCSAAAWPGPSASTTSSAGASSSAPRSKPAVSIWLAMPSITARAARSQ